MNSTIVLTVMFWSTWPSKDLPASGRSPRPVRHIGAAAGRDWIWPALVQKVCELVEDSTNSYKIVQDVTDVTYLALVHLHILGRCFKDFVQNFLSRDFGGSVPWCGGSGGHLYPHSRVPLDCSKSCFEVVSLLQTNADLSDLSIKQDRTCPILILPCSVKT